MDTLLRERKLNKLSNDYQLVVHYYTPSPGAKHRQGEGLCGPVQGRRECETLNEINAMKVWRLLHVSR
jgi:hypothetical protein